MKTSINLNMRHSDSMPTPLREDDEYYPSFHYTGEEKLDLPHEGEMTIRYKKTSSSMSEGKGGKHYSCTIEVQEIVSVEGKKVAEAPSKRDRTSEESLDKLMSEKQKKSEDY